MGDGLLKAMGATMRTLREERGASQDEVARAAGIDRAYLGRIERGGQNISVTTAARIAAALRTSTASLFADVQPAATEGDGGDEPAD